MNNLKLEDGYWVDNNTNTWNAKKYTQEEAQKMSDSLVYCYGCCDCRNCWGCKHCVECEECIVCSECVKCKKCVNCEECNDCGGCDSCLSCGDCFDCKNCEFEDNTFNLILENKS